MDLDGLEGSLWMIWRKKLMGKFHAICTISSRGRGRRSFLSFRPTAEGSISRYTPYHATPPFPAVKKKNQSNSVHAQFAASADNAYFLYAF